MTRLGLLGHKVLQMVCLSVSVTVAVRAATGAFGKRAARTPNFP